MSGAALALDDWQLTIRTSGGTVIVPFPDGTVIPAGEVLLITHTAWEVASWGETPQQKHSLLQEEGEMTTAEASVASVVLETFALPQTEFALILRSPTAFGDLTGNYFQAQKERPETAPAFTVDTVWERTQATVSGYRAEAWAASTHRNGLGTPGYLLPSNRNDLNSDGVVNILDLVLVASKFGTTGNTAGDLNGDRTVNIQDLVLVANALDDSAAAPSAKQSSAAMVNTWLQLARQNASSNAQASRIEGFSHTSVGCKCLNSSYAP